MSTSVTWLRCILGCPTLTPILSVRSTNDVERHWYHPRSVASYTQRWAIPIPESESIPESHRFLAILESESESSHSEMLESESESKLPGILESKLESESESLICGMGIGIKSFQQTGIGIGVGITCFIGIGIGTGIGTMPESPIFELIPKGQYY